MKKNTWFGIAFFIILIFALLIRLVPTLDNNFYFTMDQGDDAVHVREMLYRHVFPLLGPVTNIDGLFAGPGWYYFIAIGYVLFGGHPFGAVFMVILLSLLLLALLMLKIQREVSSRTALLVGGMLQTSWWFYDSSRYGFNPFPLVLIAFLLLFFLTDFLQGQRRYYILAGLPVGLGFHAEIAGSIALAIFYLTVGIWAFFWRRLDLKQFLFGLVVVGVFFIPHAVSEVTNGFPQTHTFISETHNPTGVFAQKGFRTITPIVYLIIARSTLRQIPTLGLIAFAITIILALYSWYTKKKVNYFVRNFSFLSLWLLLVTWIWFGSNTGWRQWHTVYLSTVIFVTVLLLLTQIPKKIAAVLLIISFVSHIVIFANRYREFLRPSDDPSLLHNELAAIDWAYMHAEGKGFYVYTYLPSVYDYPYQYLFWWYGRKKYGYVPCEYASFPGAPKIIIPGSEYYTQPQRPCGDVRFLIVEPDPDANSRRQAWLVEVRKGSRLVEDSHIGKILVEKRNMAK